MTTGSHLVPAAGPIEILYLADIRFPLERANGIQTFETCHALASLGNRVTLLVRDDTARPRRDPYTFYGLPAVPGLWIRRLRMAGPQSLRRVHYLAAAVWSVVRADRAGCVYTRDLGVADAVARIPEWLRPRLVYESHGFSPVSAQTRPDLVSGSSAGSDAKLRRLSRREQRVWRSAEGYVTITRVLAEEMQGRFGDRPFLEPVACGCRLPDPGAAAAATRALAPLVGYAGHLYPWKGVDVLIRALGQVPEMPGLIIGGFAGEPDLGRAKALAAQLGLDGRIRFTGQVEPSRVAALIADATMLVLPTIATPYAQYTSPLKLFEYFAAGKPVIASDLPPIREIVQDGRNGLLFKAGDAASLAAAIRRLRDDAALAASLGRSAFASASQYSWAARAARIESLMRRMQAAEPPAGRRA